MQFMNYHGPQVYTKEKEKKWNTGVKDTASLFTQKTNVGGEFEISDYDLQKAVN